MKSKSQRKQKKSIYDKLLFKLYLIKRNYEQNQNIKHNRPYWF